MPARNTPDADEDPKSKYTAFRCPEDLLQLAKLKAKKDRRSLSNYIICLVAKDVEGMVLQERSAKAVKRSK